ncbi:MAG: hypothetical protein A2133_11940 [Actinobacteria bacterium RBG_16_64_13]|nr:MAG: hypothetical protein A2133_11940 [Actinobacteria bacterium RBG_16_64_13]
MGRRIDISSSGGFSLMELLFVLAVLGICLAAGTVSFGGGLRRGEARGAAQSWQAATAWAQIGVLWQGGAARLEYSSGDLRVSHEYGLCGGSLGRSAPAVPVTTNVPRWARAEGATLLLTGTLASPDGGGSLYFHAFNTADRVIVRPETGLTVRSLVEVPQ